MNKFNLLKSLAPGFLPLIIFVVADSIWGVKVGLIVAVISGIIELIFSYIKEKIVDKFILLDVGMIVALGVVSIIFNNPIYFKLKPAFIEMIFCVLLGISAFSSMNIMYIISKRYMKNIEFNEKQLTQMKKSLKGLFFIFLIHTGLIIYSAFFMSEGAWAFISGGLFYIFFAVYFIFEVLKNRLNQKSWVNKYKDEEWFDIVDHSGKIKGRAPRSICHSNPEMMHPVVHLHIIDSRDRIFLQKRSMKKQIQPGKWDTAIGGHVSSGENIEDALKREAEEELGLTEFKASFIAKYVWKTEIESELVFMFYSKYENRITINKEEIDDGVFWKIKKIKESIGKDIFTPNFEFEFEILLKEIFKILK